MTESKRDYAAESLKMHYEKRGKIAVVSTVPVRTREDLSLGVHTRRGAALSGNSEGCGKIV